MTSLVGEPGASLILNFESNAALYASFFLEVPMDENVISMEFDATGSWTLSDSLITMEIGAADLTGAWYNDEELDEETKADMGASLGAELSNFSGESTIAYIAEHALVLEEPDTSISCWR